MKINIVHQPEMLFTVLVQEGKIRYLQVMMLTYIVWGVFIIIGLNISIIDKKETPLVLDQGPYTIQYKHYPNSKGAARSTYILEVEHLDLELENTKYEYIPVSVIQSAKVIKDKSLFAPKYYFYEVTYFPNNKNNCTTYLPDNCWIKSKKVTIFVPIEKINQENLELFKFMYYIFFSVWLLGILNGLYGKVR